MCGPKFEYLCARFALAAAMFAAASVPAHAETEQLNAQLSVVSPGSFYKVEDLHFGTIVSSNVAGTVTIAPNGTRTSTGGVTLWGNDHHPAQLPGAADDQWRICIVRGCHTQRECKSGTRNLFGHLDADARLPIILLIRLTAIST